MAVRHRGRKLAAKSASSASSSPQYQSHMPAKNLRSCPAVRPSAAAIRARYCDSVSAPVSICPAGAAFSIALRMSSPVSDSSSSHGPSQVAGGPIYFGCLACGYGLQATVTGSLVL